MVPISLVLALGLSAGSRIAVTTFEVLPDPDPQASSELSAAFVAALRSQPQLSVLGPEDLPQGQRAPDCPDAACLAGVGATLGVDFIVHGGVSVAAEGAPGSRRLSVELVDVRLGRGVAVSTRPIPSEDPPGLASALRDAAKAAASDLLPKLVPPAPAQAPQAALARPRRNLGALILGGAGAAGAIAGTVLLIVATGRARFQPGFGGSSVVGVAPTQVASINSEGNVGQVLFFAGVTLTIGAGTWGLLDPIHFAGTP